MTSLKFPFSVKSQYLPPDSTIPPPLESVVSNDTPNNEIAWEYRVSSKEHQEAVETGQLTMVFDPGRPGIEIPHSVHNYNSYFWWAYYHLTLSSVYCSFFIGWLISLFKNEDWCGLAEYILMVFWFLPAPAVCSYYCWFHSHHQATVPVDALLPTID